MTEWKPGDVALVTVHGETVTAMRGMDCWHYGFAEGRGFQTTYDRAFDVRAVRPLVILDHEFPRTMVNHLRTALIYNPALTTLRWLADEIEAQTSGPKPKEPTGLGAVVECDNGRRFIRTNTRDGFPWVDADLPGGNSYNWETHNGLAHSRPVRVLTEGVNA